MGRIRMQVVAEAVNRLKQVDLTKAGANLPGFFVLRKHGVAEGVWVDVSAAEFAAYADSVYGIEDAPDEQRPYFDPIGQNGWRYRNWPRGSWFTRLKDTSPLRKSGKLEVQGEGDSWRWCLKAGYLEVLPKYVRETSRLPLREFAIWYYRSEDFPEVITVANLQDSLVGEFGLTEAEVEILFDVSDDEEVLERTEDAWTDMALLASTADAVVTTTMDQGELGRELIDDAVASRGLLFDDDLLDVALAALRARKHLLLIGAPGTGKTSLAEALAEAAEKAGLTDGSIMATATSDWTTVDTVGGYWLNPDGELRFRAGYALEAMATNKWLIIDEVNRADIDKAFGQLFSVLSQQTVTLPFLHVDEEKNEYPITVTPSGTSGPPGHKIYEVPDGWRLIGTLNTRDRDLLFQMSFAFQRRFMVIEVPSPDGELYAQLLQRSSTGSEELDRILLLMRNLPGREIGPAILLDCASYLAQRHSLRAPENIEEERHLAVEALVGFIVPQLDDMSPSQIKKIVSYLSTQAKIDGKELASVLGSALAMPSRELEPADDRDDE